MRVGGEVERVVGVGGVERNREEEIYEENDSRNNNNPKSKVKVKVRVSAGNWRSPLAPRPVNCHKAKPPYRRCNSTSPRASRWRPAKQWRWLAPAVPHGKRESAARRPPSPHSAFCCRPAGLGRLPEHAARAGWKRALITLSKTISITWTGIYSGRVSSWVSRIAR